MATTSKLITGEELFAMGDIGRCELLYGEIVRMSPSGFEHGHVTARLARLLDTRNDKHKFGIVLGAEAGFRIERNPDVVRAPDASFVLAARIPEKLPVGYFEGPPDWAAEVISPSDTLPEVESKIAMWMDHGCQSCWLVDSRTRRVVIYRKDGGFAELKAPSEIEDPFLLGFRAPVHAIFAR
jgi:Uma2 family endonuclease